MLRISKPETSYHLIFLPVVQEGLSKVIQCKGEKWLSSKQRQRAKPTVRGQVCTSIWEVERPVGELPEEEEED